MAQSGQIYLASRSPRRRELLAQIGVHPLVVPVDLDEEPRPGEAPEVYVRRLAIGKARAAVETLQERMRPVLGADTAVVAGSTILGKPRDRLDGMAMLRSLSGRTHRVLTGVALIAESVHYRLSDSRVAFRPISEDEAAAYWDTGEPADKAGAYGIQGIGAVFVNNLEGSYSGVMGLPLFETAELLGAVGVDLFATSRGAAP